MSRTHRSAALIVACLLLAGTAGEAQQIEPEVRGDTVVIDHSSSRSHLQWRDLALKMTVGQQLVIKLPGSKRPLTRPTIIRTLASRVLSAGGRTDPFVLAPSKNLPARRTRFPDPEEAKLGLVKTPPDVRFRAVAVGTACLICEDDTGGGAPTSQYFAMIRVQVLPAGKVRLARPLGNWAEMQKLDQQLSDGDTSGVARLVQVFNHLDQKGTTIYEQFDFMLAARNNVDRHSAQVLGAFGGDLSYSKLNVLRVSLSETVARRVEKRALELIATARPGKSAANSTALALGMLRRQKALPVLRKMKAICSSGHLRRAMQHATWYAYLSALQLSRPDPKSGGRREKIEPWAAWFQRTYKQAPPPK